MRKFLLIALLILAGNSSAQETTNVIDLINKAVSAVSSSATNPQEKSGLRLAEPIDLEAVLANEIPQNHLAYHKAVVNPEQTMVEVPTLLGEYRLIFYFTEKGELQLAALTDVVSTEIVTVEVASTGEKGLYLYREENTVNLLNGIGLNSVTRTKLDENGAPIGKPELMSTTEFLPEGVESLPGIVTPGYIILHYPFEIPH